MEGEVWSLSQQGCRHVWIDWFQNTNVMPLKHVENEEEVLHSLTHWRLYIRVPHTQELAETARVQQTKSDTILYIYYLNQIIKSTSLLRQFYFY